MMKYPDLDGMFKGYLFGLLQAKELEAEAIEEQLPELYMDWTATPNKALADKKPSEVYKGLSACELIDELISCIGENKTPSDLLLDAIVDAPDCAPVLLDIITGGYGGFSHPDQLAKARRIAASLVNQTSPDIARDVYINLVLDGDPLGDAAIEGLLSDPAAALEKILAVVDEASDEAREALMGVAAECRDERVYNKLISYFKQQSGSRGYFAQLIAHYGDDRALPVLQGCINGESYYDYISIKEAVEALGGEVTAAYEFSGDSDYDRIAGNNDK